MWWAYKNKTCENISTSVSALLLKLLVIEGLFWGPIGPITWGDCPNGAPNVFLAGLLLFLFPPNCGRPGNCGARSRSPVKKLGFRGSFGANSPNSGLFSATSPRSLNAPPSFPWRRHVSGAWWCFYWISYYSEKEPSSACSLWNGTIKLQKSNKTNY